LSAVPSMPSVPEAARDYVAAGLRLVPLEAGTKKALGLGWNRVEAAISDQAAVGPHLRGVGLAHAWSGTCALDVDHFEMAQSWLAGAGVDLSDLLESDDGVRIVSRPGRAKLLYRMPKGLVLPSKTIKRGDVTMLELRCATEQGLTVQDVLPPSVHPDTRRPYSWGGNGDWRSIPTIPETLLAVWRDLLTVDRRTDVAVEVPERSDAAAASGKARMAPRAHERARDASRTPGGRSEAVWDTLMHLVEQGASDAEVVSVLTDATLGVSAKPLSKSNPTAWLAPQIAKARANVQKGKEAAVKDAGGTPLDILREYPVPAFTEACVPPVIWRLADAFHKASGFDRSGLVMAATVAAASVIDDRLRLAVRPASNWFESARLWAVLIGPPSAGKSPTLKAATDPIKELHRDLLGKWTRDVPDPEAEGAPPRPALFTSDATVEKLADLLKGNPRGMLMLTEEFASWIGGIDAYRDGAGGKGRGEWLQLYDGGPHQVDRIKRGSFFVPNWSCSVLAAGTPAGLRSHLRQLPDDGLIHRFMPVILARAGEESGASASAELTGWSLRLRSWFDATTREGGSRAHRISVNAQLPFEAERKAIRGAVDALAEVSPALASHIGKHPGMLARVALTFHVADERQGDAIEADTMRQAVAFMRTVRQHAAALFLGILSQSPALDLARALARSLLATEPNPREVGRNEFLQRCRAWRGASENDQRQAVQLLVDARWLIPDPTSRAYGGWSASRWLVEPAVFTRFAEHGRDQIARREAVRRVLVGAGDEA
jgi:hypothetical protein